MSRPSANLHGVFFLTKEEGWAVGQLGKIFHTIDGGKSWEEQHSGTNLLLTAVDFVDRTRGWIVGERGIILASEDGGATWRVQQSGVTYPLFDVGFIDGEKGWAVGHWGTMLFTEDGGKRWVERSLALDLSEAKGPIDPAVLHDVTDPQSGEVVVKAGQLLTKDIIAEITQRGISGVRIREDIVLNTVFFLNQTHGWVAGERGVLLRTADGGQQWEKIILPRPPRATDEVVEDEMMSEEELEAFGVISPPPSLYGVYFISPQQGWVVGQDGTVAHTQDGGYHWEFQPVATRESLYDVGIAGETGWIVGDKGTVLVSADGGAAWEQQELGVEYRLSWLRRLAVVPGDLSFLVGADGLVLASGQSPGQGLWLRPPTQQ